MAEEIIINDQLPVATEENPTATEEIKMSTDELVTELNSCNIKKNVLIELYQRILFNQLERGIAVEPDTMAKMKDDKKTIINKLLSVIDNIKLTAKKVDALNDQLAELQHKLDISPNAENSANDTKDASNSKAAPLLFVNNTNDTLILYRKARKENPQCSTIAITPHRMVQFKTEERYKEMLEIENARKSVAAKHHPVCFLRIRATWGKGTPAVEQDVVLCGGALTRHQLVPERIDFIRLGEEAMRSDVEAVAVPFDRARNAADERRCLKDRHLPIPGLLKKFIGGRKPRRPCSNDYQLLQVSAFLIPFIDTVIGINAFIRIETSPARRRRTPRPPPERVHHVSRQENHARFDETTVR